MRTSWRRDTLAPVIRKALILTALALVAAAPAQAKQFAVSFSGSGDYLSDYSVDVSSPGLERPVRKPEHFRAAVGRRVALRTKERTRVRGEVVAADERTVTVKTQAESVDIPYDAIVRGNLIEEAGKR